MELELFVVLFNKGIIKGRAEFRRLVIQGAIRINGMTAQFDDDSVGGSILIKVNDEIQVGKSIKFIVENKHE